MFIPVQLTVRWRCYKTISGPRRQRYPVACVLHEQVTSGERKVVRSPEARLLLLLGCERWAAHNVRRTRKVAQAIFGNYEIKRLQSIRGGFPVRGAGDTAQKLRRAGIAKKSGGSGRRRMRQHGTDGRSTRL